MISYTEGNTESAAERKNDPDENVGLLMVIDCRDNVSTAVVLRSNPRARSGRSDPDARGSGG